MNEILGNVQGMMPKILEKGLPDVTYLYAKYVPPLMEATIINEMILKTLAIF